jgi:hypothetical protein
MTDPGAPAKSFQVHDLDFAALDIHEAPSR